jgi:hypothetical protein
MKESHTLYHKSYTDAINAALKHSDLNVSDEDRDTHIAMGPRKPAEGETVKHHIPATDKNGDKHIIHIQVYNKGGNKPFELNTYSSKKGVSFSSVSKKKVAEETEMRHSSDSLGDHMALKAYANKLGPKHIDRHDLLTAASHMAFGNMDHLKKHLKALDTDVRDKALEYVARRHYAELGYGVRKEEADIDEALGTIKNMKAASKFGSSNVSDMIRGEKARKATMAKVSTTRDIGYKVVDVGPGQKETIRKMHNFKEEDQIDELKHSGGVLNNYLSKTNPDRNTPEDNVKRAAGRGMALRKKWGKALGVNEPKVPATNEEIEPLAEISAALARRASRASMDE